MAEDNGAKEVIELLKQSCADFVSNKPQDAEQNWQKAAAMLKAADHVDAEVLKAALTLAAKQSWYGCFDEAQEKFELAIRLWEKDIDGLPNFGAEATAKYAMNEVNRGQTDAALQHFERAVVLFEKSDDRNLLEYADCLNHYGKLLQSCKKYSQSIDAHEKAYKVYPQVTSMAPTDMAQRLQVIRHEIITSSELARGKVREVLRKRVSALLDLPEVNEVPTLKEGLKTFHKAGLAKGLTLKDAMRALGKPLAVADVEEDDDDGDNYDLLRVLRMHYSSGADSQDGWVVYAEPLTIADADEVLADLAQRAGESSLFKVVSWSTQLSAPITFSNGGRETTITYNRVRDLVELVNKQLAARKAKHKFCALEGAEDEGVFMLLPLNVLKRFEEKNILPFDLG